MGITLTSAPAWRRVRRAGLVLSGTLLAATLTTQAQVLPSATKQARFYNTLSVHLTAMNYFGDLAPKPSFTSFRFGATRPNIGVSLKHRFARHFSARAALSYGRITGSDKLGADQNDEDAAYRYNRGLSFRNDIVEASVVGVIDLFENRGSYLKRRDFSPYLFLGVAAFYNNPKGERDGKWIALQPLGTEGQRASGSGLSPYKKLQISIPFGVGVDYKLSRQYSVGYEIGWRKTFTDYIDDVSGTYFEPTKLSNDANSDVRYFADRSNHHLGDNTKFERSYLAGQQRGSDNDDDWYIVSGLHLSYILIPQTKSPKFR